MMNDEDRRDRFALAAMTAIIAKLPLTVVDADDNAVSEMVAAGAVTYADALLRELDV